MEHSNEEPMSAEKLIEMANSKVVIRGRVNIIRPLQTGIIEVRAMTIDGGNRLAHVSYEKMVLLDSDGDIKDVRKTAELNVRVCEESEVLPAARNIIDWAQQYLKHTPFLKPLPVIFIREETIEGSDHDLSVKGSTEIDLQFLMHLNTIYTICCNHPNRDKLRSLNYRLSAFLLKCQCDVSRMLGTRMF